METTKKNLILEKYSNKLTDNGFINLNKYLDQADDSSYELLNSVKLKSLAPTLLLSLFFGGIGAGFFYLRENMMGGYNLIIHTVLVALSFVFAYVLNMLIIAIIIDVIDLVLVIIFIVAACTLVKDANTRRLSAILGHSLK